MQVTVITRTLSDDSKVYDVEFSDSVVFSCTSFRDACEFCDKLSIAVNAHTTNELDIYWKG